MLLSELLSALSGDDAPSSIQGEDPIVRGVAYDSRAVSPGDLFVALVGHDADGHAYLQKATGLGAVAALVEDATKVPEGFPHAVVANTRRALAPLATHFFGDPAQELALIGITGTNGKTSTCFLLESIFEAAGEQTGMIGTVEVRYADQRRRAVNTTPESLDLQHTLRDMVTRGIGAVAMEVSSHGLALGRVEGCQFAVAAVTNVSQDHLDFHEDMEAYTEAKAQLFRKHLAPGAHAVIQMDDPRSRVFIDAAREANANLIRVTRRPDGDAEVRVVDAEVRMTGSRVRMELPSGPLDVELPLLGDFNIENLAVAVGVAVARGIAPDLIARGVASCGQVPGRTERVSTEAGLPTVIVDYAHTPDAVDKLLRTLAPLTEGRLITVFGCGGDRDPTKRAPMAEAVARHSDRALATSDNPRTEDPSQILADVEQGLRTLVASDADRLDQTDSGYVVIEDRRLAIECAISMAKRADMVVLAGKGHEDYQILGTQKFPFDDREEAQRALSSWTEQAS